MNKYVVLCLLFISLHELTYAQFDKSSFLATGLTLVDIKTINGEEPTCDFVFHPEGAMGTSSTNTTKVPGRILLIKQVESGNDTIFDSGEYVQGISGMKIKIRGNTSAYAYREIEKYPFKICLQKKADLLCRGNVKYQDKDWVLINTANKFGNDIGRCLSKQMGMEFTPESEYVNVFINEKYRGTYLLSENVKRNPGCRIDVNKNAGYIIEHDPYWWNEDISFGDYFVPSYRYTFKYPDSDNVTVQQTEYISNAVSEMEESIVNGNYEDFIDVESFARWLLAEDILGSWDGGGVNLFVAKKDNTTLSRFTLPCLWDYDSAFECGENKWSNLRGRFFFQTLMDSDNRSFAITYKNLWNDKGKEYCTAMVKYIGDFKESEKYSYVKQSFQLEEQWYAAGGHKYLANKFLSWLDYAEKWFQNRPIWMDEQIKNIETGIRNTNTVNNSNNANTIHDIYGRRIRNAECKGVYIIDGKKQIR